MDTELCTYQPVLLVGHPALKNTFPEQETVFFAGFGNRETGVGAYQAVGVPDDMIFTINPNGEVKDELTNTFQTSYGNLASDQKFPPH